MVTETPALSEADKRITSNETSVINQGKNIQVTQIANGCEIATANNMTLGEKQRMGKPGTDGSVRCLKVKMVLLFQSMEKMAQSV